MNRARCGAKAARMRTTHWSRAASVAFVQPPASIRQHAPVAPSSTSPYNNTNLPQLNRDQSFLTPNSFLTLSFSTTDKMGTLWARNRRPLLFALPLTPLPRRISTRCAIDGPDGLPNARDLATASPLVRTGKIFRGATPAALPPRPHPDALEFLRGTHTLIDLRSKDERRDDHLDRVVKWCGDDFEHRERHIGLLNKRKVVWGLARVLPREQVKDLAIRVVLNPLGARRGIVQQMDQGGLVLLNRIIVEAGASQIGRALNEITTGVSADHARGRVYFYCSAGKDRTGLLAALILHLLQVPEHDVIRDYVRSSEVWNDGPYEWRLNYSAKLVHHGLTPNIWIGAPAEVMHETLRYIKRKFGSVEDYVIHCGFEKHRIKKLQNVMML